MIRARALAALILAAALAALSGCSSNPIQGAPPSVGSVVSPERGSRGNPPFYEVFGERYYVLQSADGYRERGKASWYGPEFQGKPTSGGEIFDMHAMTAAHKTLPIPTWVEVTNLANNRSVIVKVNDRGPFVDDRIIDLSFQAAQELDMIRTGTAEVRIRALGAPAAVPSPREAPPAPAVADARRARFSIISEARADTLGPEDYAVRSLYVQVGAFSERRNALGLVDRLKRNGFTNSFIVSSDDGRPLHRVRIGPLVNAEQYDRVSASLKSLGIGETRLVVEN